MDTPERKADLKNWLHAEAEKIADAGLKREYENFFSNCVYERLRPQRSPRGSAGKFKAKPAVPAIRNPNMRWCQQAALFAAFLRHPELLDEVAEEFQNITFQASDLDRLRREILNVHDCDTALDATRLKHHLTKSRLCRGIGRF